MIGHWWLLLAYGLLPWVVRLAAVTCGPGAGWPSLARLWVAVAAGSLVPTAGVLMAVTVSVVVAFEAAGGRRSRLGGLGVLASVAQLPWVLPAAPHAGIVVDVRRAPGVEAFAAGRVGLGGIWNSEVVPDIWVRGDRDRFRAPARSTVGGPPGGP